MKSTRLDLGLAIAACARGYACMRKDDPNEKMIMDNGHIVIERLKGKNCRLEHHALWLDTTSTVWYIVGDDKTWLDKEIV